MTDLHQRPIPQRRKLFSHKEMMAKKLSREFGLPLRLIALHLPLGILLYRSSALALIYPLIVFFLGLYWASRPQEKTIKVAYAAAYLVGAEVLWRMAESSIYWEFGKYGMSLIMIVALVQRGYRKIPKLPLLYFVCLLPSALLTIFNNSLSDARGKISFNLSGPLALFVCCWFFSYVRVNWLRLKKILITLTVPIISVAVVTLFYTITTQNIQFTSESNHALSGGFGPNQVSSILGLGVFACLVCFLLFANDVKYKIYIAALTVFFAAQSVMTFSRGGMYAAAGATLVVVLFHMRNLNKNVKRLLPIAALVLFFLIFIFPYMNAFTGGKLKERFEDSGTTNRTEIVESDVILFLKNPIFGTGVGESKDIRQKIIGFESASHTEFSRIISEHGSFGVLSLLALGLAAFYNLKKQRSSLGKALIAGALAWSGLFMLNAGMRLAAPAFIWGLSFITLIDATQISEMRRQRRRRQQFAERRRRQPIDPENKDVE